MPDSADLAKLKESYTRHWVCVVVRYGYEKGEPCSPTDRHDDGRCGFYWVDGMSSDGD